MPEVRLSQEERSAILNLAREALEKGVRGEVLPSLDYKTFPPLLAKPGATFVTLTRRGNLRGCIGTLEPYQSLAEDIREHAIAAGLHDYRFPPVTPDELPEIEIEVSCLSQPEPLNYGQPDDLLERLRPGVDGVVLRDGIRRSTFLPQVWEKLPDPATFLDHLCMKMGGTPDLWRCKKLEVLIYQVEEIHE